MAIDESTIASLISASRDAMTKAYCPYSTFPVGAAILCDDGSVYTGTSFRDDADLMLLIRNMIS